MVYYYIEELCKHGRYVREAERSGSMDRREIDALIKEKEKQKKRAARRAEAAHLPLLPALIPCAAMILGACACCAYGRETAAGLFMLGSALFLGTFARERAVIFGVIVPAYVVVLFSGDFSLPALCLGACAAVGSGAFLFRINKIVFFAGSLITLGIGVALAGNAGGLACVALSLTAAVLGTVYPVSRIGESVAYTAAALGIAVLLLGAVSVFIEGGASIEVLAELPARIKRQLISAVGAAAAADTASGALEQYVDSVMKLLPGLFAAAVEVLAFFMHCVCGAIFRSASMEPEAFTTAPSRYIVSPITALLYFAATLVCAAVDESGTVSVVCENIMLMLSLPLAVYAVFEVTQRLRRAELEAIGKLVVAAAVLATIFGGWQGVCILAAAGAVMSCILPLGAFIGGIVGGGGGEQ